VRRKAPQVLYHFRHSESIPHLVDLLEDESLPVVRAALVALTNFGGKEAARSIVPMVCHPTPKIAQMAREVLGRALPRRQEFFEAVFAVADTALEPSKTCRDLLKEAVRGPQTEFLQAWLAPKATRGSRLAQKLLKKVRP
jgi:HEAT repeat protein